CTCSGSVLTPACSALQRDQVHTFPGQDRRLPGRAAAAIGAGNEVVADGAVTGHQQRDGVASHQRRGQGTACFSWQRNARPRTARGALVFRAWMGPSGANRERCPHGLTEQLPEKLLLEQGASLRRSRLL